MKAALWIAATAVTVAACSPSESAAGKSASPDPRSKEALESAGHRLDVLAATRQDAQAWEYYSARCKAKIGGLGAYSAELDEFFRGRHPNYQSATAVVDGSSGKVISVDADPSAPASASLPRTWTFIDGRWQFDNC